MMFLYIYTYIEVHLDELLHYIRNFIIIYY